MPLGYDPNLKELEDYLETEENVKRTKVDLEEFASAKDRKCTPMVLVGDPGEVICKTAEQEKVDQIVMGSRGLNLLSK